jgi:hypothetical protein
VPIGAFYLAGFEHYHTESVRADGCNRLARLTPFQQELNFIMSTDTDWRVPVAKALRGRTIAFTAEIAREALGRSYESMSARDWGRLAAAIKAAGYRRGHVDRHPVWVAPEASPIAPAPVQQESLPL